MNDLCGTNESNINISPILVSIGSYKLLLIKEETCMVKISNFILKNYKECELFLVTNHPTYLILKEMTKQILELLNVNYEKFDSLSKNDNYVIQDCRLPHSKYDKKIIDYDIKIDDNKIKELIKEIYMYM